MAIDAGIFRRYDIRGIAGAGLDARAAQAIGHAYGSELRARTAAVRRDPSASAPAPPSAPKVVVGQDNRPSSPSLAEALVRGLRAAGCDVVTLGTVPTPVTYFAEYNLSAQGAVQVTGSHNPPEYNGVKMTIATAPFFGDAIQDLLRRIGEGDLADGAGGLEAVDPLPDYVTDVAERFRLARPVKVVVDCGNGTGSVTAVPLLEAAGAHVVPLYCESDGAFPNHHPDPTVDENMVDLVAAVRRHGAEAGIGFDGDADRIGVVDEHGRIVRADVLLLLFGLDLLRRNGPGAQLIFDVKCSQVLPAEFERAGGVPVMWKTGHSLIKEKMRETGAPIAGELSGHICFADDYYGFDDALYAACRLLALLAASERPLSDLVEALPSYCSTPELRIDLAEADKSGLVERARAHFARDHEVADLDGVRVLFEGGWGLLRASNTQPVVVARYEAETEERLAQIRATMEEWLRGQGVSP